MKTSIVLNKLKRFEDPCKNAFIKSDRLLLNFCKYRHHFFNKTDIMPNS